MTHHKIFRAVHCCQAITRKTKKETCSWQNQTKTYTHTNKTATDPKQNERFLCFSAAKKVNHWHVPLHATQLSEAFGDIISDPVVEWLHRGTPMVWICAASQQGYSDVTPRALAAFFDDSEGLGNKELHIPPPLAKVQGGGAA